LIWWYSFVYKPMAVHPERAAIFSRERSFGIALITRDAMKVTFMDTPLPQAHFYRLSQALFPRENQIMRDVDARRHRRPGGPSAPHASATLSETLRWIERRDGWRSGRSRRDRRIGTTLIASD
jgi:hypothetical protein